VDRQFLFEAAMINTGLSRWTMAYFAAAFAAFLAAQLLMALGLAYPAEPLMSARTLVAVHLVTIGWLTLLMLGALLQFVPVITGSAVIGERAGLASLLAIGVGLIGMIVGFLALDGTLPAACTGALALGGGAVVVGVALVAVTIGRALVAGRPLALPGRFVAAGLCFLCLTVLLGVSFALALAWPDYFAWDGLVVHGLGLHIATGIIGWFTLTAIGVSYRLLSMFMLAPEEDGGIGRWVLRLATAGIGLFWAEPFFGGTPFAGIAASGGALLSIIAAGLYLADMVRIFRQRKRPVLELNSIAGAAALVAFGASVLAFGALEFSGRLSAFVGPLIYLYLFGWLSGLGLGQLYKIVPFLTWLERYGPRLGKEAVPRVQDLVSERRAAPWFVAYFLAVAAGAIAGALGVPLVWRAAILVHLVASILIARELWRARYGRPAALAVPAPPALSTTAFPQIGASP